MISSVLQRRLVFTDPHAPTGYRCLTLISQIAKKLVNSDFKNNRVEDPTHISSRQEKQVKKYVKDFFDKAVAKRCEHERKKAERKAKEGGLAKSPVAATPDRDVKKEEESDGDEMMEMSDDEAGKEEQKSSPPVTPASAVINGDNLKRKRQDEDESNGLKVEDLDATPSKVVKAETPPPPPPPPPPPAEDMPVEEMSIVNTSAEVVAMDDGSLALVGEVLQTPTATEDIMDDAAFITPPSPSAVDREPGPLKGKLGQTNGRHSPMDIESPPTPGPPTDYMTNGTTHKLEGMDPERLRRLGIHSGI